jgi:hypothetical protein
MHITKQGGTDPRVALSCGEFLQWEGLADSFHVGYSGQNVSVIIPDEGATITMTVKDSLMEVYLDGIKQGEATTTDKSDLATDLNIGSNGTDEQMDGYLKDFKVWHTALTPEQISTL